MLLRFGGWSYHADLASPALMKCDNGKGVQWVTGTEQRLRGLDGTPKMVLPLCTTSRNHQDPSI